MNLAAKEKLEIVIGAAEPHVRIFAGAFLAAFGGENRPNYFKSRPPVYTVKIAIDRIVGGTIKVITNDRDYALIGRDVLNELQLFLKGRDKSFEIN